MAFENTLVIIKSHACPYTGQILTRPYSAGLAITIQKRAMLTDQQIEALYAEHVGRPYYENLCNSVRFGVVAAVLRGEDAVARWRQMLGATDPRKAFPGTIRSGYGNHAEGMMHENAAHGSDSVESAEREIGIIFPELPR